MLKGLRKRETYEELINELGEDPIKEYPDRRASQIENSIVSWHQAFKKS